jgi:hypothetical protein
MELVIRIEAMQTELKRFDFPKLVDGGTSYGIQKCDAPDLFRVRLSQYIQQREK